jgi:hypothetical protein
MFVFIGASQSRLDDFFIKPKKITKGKLNGEQCEIYYYFEGHDSFPLKGIYSYHTMNVYIIKGRVVKMRGTYFDPYASLP